MFPLKAEQDRREYFGSDLRNILGTVLRTKESLRDNSHIHKDTLGDNFV